MKKLIFTIILILSQLLIIAQCDESCLPEGITFTTQEEIDNFQTNYPNYTEIEGDVEINGNYITNLIGLNILTAFGGDLTISSNDALISLTGLENVASVGGNLIIEYNDALINFTGLDNVSHIGGNLKISGHDCLINLAGLESLTSIGLSLRFILNHTLINLTGLENLTSIGGSLSFLWNNDLVSLTALENLTYIGVGIGIDSNDALTNLSGLENISSLEGGGISIYSNDLLVNLTGLDNLTSVSGGIDITGSYSFSSLIGLDNLTYIGGDLAIFNTDIFNLDELDNLTSIEGGITIRRNHSLTCLSELDNINFESIDFLEIYNNSNLSLCEIENICGYLANPGGPVTIYNNATGCNSPTEIASNCGFVLTCLPYGNYYFKEQIDIDSFQVNYPNCTNLEGIVEISGSELTNLIGLNVVTSIGEDLNISNNDSLTNLIGLDNVTSIGRDLLINANNELTSVTGLENLASIEGDLLIGKPGWFITNPSLTDLSGLTNIAFIEGDLSIWGNNSLSTCEVQSVCDYLASPNNGSISIGNNANGCNSQAEVETACLSISVPEINIEAEISIYPNPTKNKLFISAKDGLIIKEINIYNQIGQRIIHKKGITNTIDVSMLRQGMYIVEIEIDNVKVRSKLMIE